MVAESGDTTARNKMVQAKRHTDEYKNISGRQFKLIGMEMLLRPVDGPDDTTMRRRFIGNFGCLPDTCALLWNKCLTSGFECFYAEVESFKTLKLKGMKKKTLHQNYPPYKPRHLLWALNFLKAYSTEEQKNALGKETEKTMREWIWKFIEAISSLKNEVVSDDKSFLF